MQGKDNKHVTVFRETKLKAGEEVVAHLEGWIGEMMGKGDKTNGTANLFSRTSGRASTGRVFWAKFLRLSRSQRLPPSKHFPGWVIE